MQAITWTTLVCQPAPSGMPGGRSPAMHNGRVKCYSTYIICRVCNTLNPKWDPMRTCQCTVHRVRVRRTCAVTGMSLRLGPAAWLPLRRCRPRRLPAPCRPRLRQHLTGFFAPFLHTQHHRKAQLDPFYGLKGVLGAANVVCTQKRC